uniref:Uncharacterized protein n=1 Tax=Cyanistes caeruleus TaxID=156563 RepID=A0A8C0VPZ6_CYACU
IHGGCSLRPGKVSRYSTVLYPALHQSQMKPVGSVWSLIQRESSAKPCSLCSSLRLQGCWRSRSLCRDHRSEEHRLAGWALRRFLCRKEQQE